MHYSHKDLSEVLRSSVIPWVQINSLRCFVAQSPFHGVESGAVTVRSEPLLGKPEQYSFSLHPVRWPQLGLHACRYPCLAFVLEGETDISVGLLRGAMDKSPRSGGENRLAVLSLLPRTCLLIPPGVPYAGATYPHWCRDNVEAAFARVLWVRALPMGALIQISRTQNATQFETPAMLSKAPQLLPLMRLLLAEAQHWPPMEEVVASYLQTLLLSLDHSVMRNYIATSNHYVEGRELLGDERDYQLSNENGAQIIERACDYIYSNLIDTELSVPMVARAAYISTSRLERLFRSELKTSVMKYVNRCRLEEAQFLLIETDLAISEISGLCGFEHRTHFSRCFSQTTGLSPREFRQRKQHFVIPKSAQGYVSLTRREIRQASKAPREPPPEFHSEPLLETRSKQPRKRAKSV